MDFPRRILRLVALCCTALPAWAQIPPGYYAGIDETSAATLRTTLHARIKDHTRFPYTAATTDTWTILELADQDPGNAAHILDLYKNQSLVKQGGGNSFYNREHSWPNSYGFPNDGVDNYPYTDCHHLFLCDITYNADRGNMPYRPCTSGCSEESTLANGGAGGGTGSYPGNSNWTSASPTAGSWETWRGRRGDVARAQFYLDVRYEGGVHGITGAPEPDLRLTDNVTLIQNSSTGSNEAIAYMGLVSTLIVWNREDPPDAKERARNDVVYSFQGNRNPFIDHPEWVDCLYAGACRPGQAFCFGSGIDTSHTTPCPCGNAGATGNGCANSVNAAGANLNASGHTASDTVVLTGSGVPSTSFTLFMQHDAAGDTVFHDGVLCAGGTLIRLRGHGAVGGVVSFPDSSDTVTVSQRGAVAIGSGVRRYYAAWYRNAATTYCTPATANVTNGLQVVW